MLPYYVGPTYSVYAGYPVKRVRLRQPCGPLTSGAEADVEQHRAHLKIWPQT